jgi:hypothetical protein
MQYSQKGFKCYAKLTTRINFIVSWGRSPQSLLGHISTVGWQQGDSL